jgi:hypothetical protein
VVEFIRKSVFLAVILSLLLILGNAATTTAQQSEAGVRWDPPMRIPSSDDSNAWFPDLAVDSRDRVHVVWCQTKSTDAGEIERVFYSRWDGHQWSPYNDIVPPQADIIRNSIAVDAFDTLHFIFGWQKLYYKRAQADQATSAAAWTSPRLVNTRYSSYMSDIVVYNNTLHVIYDDVGAEDGECPRCADIYYRHSTNGGLTWSAPVGLFPTGTGSSREQIKVDEKGGVYVAWDEGWDRFTGRGEPKYSVYMYSSDGGNTWSSPTTVSYPNSTNAQLAVDSDGQGGVMLVWRTTSSGFPSIYYMWSKDYGSSWSPPQVLPGIFARNWVNPFDRYTMAMDSVRHIHLLVVGHLSQDRVGLEPPGLYHLEWDGDSWSSPSTVYKGSWYPEYPHLVIHDGNQLHATWFLREDMSKPKAPHQVWYARGLSSAPAVTPIPQSTLTPTPTSTPKAVVTTTPTPTAAPSPTPPLTLDPSLERVTISADTISSIYTDTDDLMLLAKSLIPAALLVVAVVVGIRLRRR